LQALDISSRMTKQHILDEIRRTAKDNGGAPLGQQRFFGETGIKKSDWYGKFWATWGDALREAGLAPNQLQEPYSEEVLFDRYISLVRELGRLPVDGDLKLKTRSDPTFPSTSTYQLRFGSKSGLVTRLLAFCRARSDYDDVAQLCERYSVPRRNPNAEPDASDGDVEVGFVYLIKSGRYYKVGRTNAAGRREREIALQLPEKATTVHIIRTDDPVGIEAYWHKRFEPRHKNGEWFELGAADIAAFKRRKFM
jgi:hypothetical protein